MRTYDGLVSAIIDALPTAAEIEPLTDEQVQTLRRYGNRYDNVLYMHTREWTEWLAKNPPPAYAGRLTGEVRVMTPEQETVQAIKAEVAKLPEESQLRVKFITMSLRNMLAVDPGHAAMAIALVGAELEAAE